MYLNQKDGWIEVITGPMFAGKTEELIRRVKRLEYAKQNILVFKPQIDNRYADNEVVSHNHNRTKSINITKAHEIVSYISRIMTLYPGDVIATGTPSGVGPMSKGDVVEVRLNGVGILRNYME